MALHGPICFNKFIGGSNTNTVPDSVSSAIAENPRNGSLTMPPNPNIPSGPLHLAMVTRKFWRAGRELKIGWQGGSSWQKDKVRQYASQWCQYANIRFTYVDAGEVDILVSFDPSTGSWSYVGTDSTYFSSKNQPSLNLGWINDAYSEEQLQSVILHEFGHALGATHEHESPYSKIPWNKEQVYKDLGGPPNNWSREKIDAAMFTLNTLQDTQASPFDPDSVMLYYYPANWTTDGKGTSFNYKLSSLDQQYVKFCYPADSLDAGQFNTMEVRPWNKPQLDNSKTIYYQKKYDTFPELPLGLTSLDIDKSGNIRIAASASDATTESFTATLKSWADTTLYSASMTYLEKSSSFSYIQTGIYNTTETRPWNTPSPTVSKRINFATPFSAPPQVITWLQALDMDKSKNWRIRVYATDINQTGFTIHADTWDNSILYSAGVTWLAYPSDQPRVTSGKFNTTEVRAWNQPQSDNTSAFKFLNPFSTVPKVIMAIDTLDYDCRNNLRLRLSTSSVTTTELAWHLQSWDNSIMYSAGASFFAWT